MYDWRSCLAAQGGKASLMRRVQLSRGKRKAAYEPCRDSVRPLSSAFSTLMHRACLFATMIAPAACNFLHRFYVASYYAKYIVLKELIMRSRG